MSSSTSTRPLELKFRLDEVPPEGRRFVGELPVATLQGDLPGLVGDLGYRPEAPARIEGTVYRSAKSELVVDGTLTATVGFDCVRCLQARTLDAKIREDHVLVRREKLDGAGEMTLSEDALEEPDVESFTGDEIDLTDLFRQDLLLALPMNPSCETAGRGGECHALAPEARADEPEVDPRWAPLLELKKKLT
ncbi:MAG: DUF177 domain-containing protein [Myxococcales bacterium]|nr:DUF177 domain-containing protein [Myxococcales bacterium]MCB9552946.1 DUF177 domain-containing protein [Myxococcales bacterium]